MFIADRDFQAFGSQGSGSFVEFMGDKEEDTWAIYTLW